MRTIMRWAILVVAGVLLLFVGLLAWVADNSPFPYHLCLPLKEQFIPPGLRGVPDPGGTLVPLPPPEQFRDFAFAHYGVVVETRLRLQKMSIRYYGNSPIGGYTDLANNTVNISPYFTVVLHEYAHVIFNEKSLVEKMWFSLNALWVLFDPGQAGSPSWAIFWDELHTAIFYFNTHRSYNPLWEVYAHWTEYTQGDLLALPERLRFFYADYLQSKE